MWREFLVWLTTIAFPIYPNTDINTSSFCIRHATSVDSLLWSAQGILRTRTITFFEIEIHAPSIAAWRAFTTNTNPSRVCNVVQSYKCSISSSWSRVWTAVETHPTMTWVVSLTASIGKDDAVVGAWRDVWKLTVSHMYPCTCVLSQRANIMYIIMAIQGQKCASSNFSKYTRHVGLLNI